MSRTLLALWLLVIPAAAEACATCISSPYGDRTYGWPYLLLIALPFGVAVVIAGVLARVSGIRVSALASRARRARHGRSSRATDADLPAVRQGETI